MAIVQAASQAAPQPQPEVATADDYRNRKLMRVRAQIDMLQDSLDGALAGAIQQLDRKGEPRIIDPAGIDRICNSIRRLSEWEGELAGRAKPGNLRPAPERSKGRRTNGDSGSFYSSPPPQPIVSSGVSGQNSAV